MNRDEQYVFDLESTLLESLQLLHFDESLAIVNVEHPESTHLIHEEQTATKVKNLSECTSCHFKFGEETPQQEKNEHYKSDLHRLNLKRSLNGLIPLSEAEFEEYLETQSVESISGSEDSDTESDTEFETEKLSTVFEKLSTNQDQHAADEERQVSHMNTQSPFVMLRSSKLEEGMGFGAYKALFDSKTLDSGKVTEALHSFNSSQSKSGLSVILMIGGGHFAGAVISHQRLKTKGNAKNHKESLQAQKVSVLESKTFHRYTTRRKQGGSQSASDNARGKANSAGSSIRRYNEQALKKDVHDLLVTWKKYLSQANHIFVRANGADSRKTLMGHENSLLQPTDPRIKSLPFTTKRATLSEVKNSWVKLTYLSVVDLPKAKKSTEKVQKEERTVKTPEIIPESEADKYSRELIGLLKKSKAPLLVNFVKISALDVNMALTPQNQYSHTPTALHYAAAQGLQHMVKVLLTNLNADPTLLNASGKTAYQVGNSKEVRAAFQICRHSLGEDYCDWKAAKVGPPKSADEFAAENAREKEAQNAESRRLIEEELAKKTEFELKTPTIQSSGIVGGGKVFSQVAETSGLTDQQKMRLMREQRARAAEARMKRGGQ